MSDESLARYFDRCADDGVMDSFSPEDEGKLRRFMELWDIQPGERILEPGCGSGRLTERLAGAAGPEGEVLAFDLSPRMIEKARERGLPGQVEFAVASAEAMPTEDGCFDKAICFHVFPHFNDKAAALSEIARALRPGGRIWVTHLSSRSEINELHKGLGPEVSAHQIPSGSEMRALVEAAGFVLDTLEDSPDGYWVCAVLTT